MEALQILLVVTMATYLGALLAMLRLERKGQRIMSALDDLIAQVAATAGAEASAAAAFTGLAQAYEAALAANDPTKLAALTAQLKASAASLAAAVAADPLAPAQPPAQAPAAA